MDGAMKRAGGDAAAQKRKKARGGDPDTRPTHTQRRPAPPRGVSPPVAPSQAPAEEEEEFDSDSDEFYDRTGVKHKRTKVVIATEGALAVSSRAPARCAPASLSPRANAAPTPLTRLSASRVPPPPRGQPQLRSRRRRRRRSTACGRSTRRRRRTAPSSWRSSRRSRRRSGATRSWRSGQRRRRRRGSRTRSTPS